MKTKKRKISPRRLTTGVAHEIKNCLTGIRGCLQVFDQDFPDEAPQKQITREILSDVGRLDVAVKTLLLLAVSPEPNPVPVCINNIVQNVKTTLEARRSGTGLNIEFVPGMVPEILIDPEQLRLALLNIAACRIHAIGEEGSIVFATSERRSSCEVEISVADKGTGAAGDRAGASSPFDETGAGLGLAIGRSIIECNKGRIDVRRAKGTVATVSIILKKKGRE